MLAVAAVHAVGCAAVCTTPSLISCLNSTDSGASEGFWKPVYVHSGVWSDAKALASAIAGAKDGVLVFSSCRMLRYVAALPAAQSA